MERTKIFVSYSHFDRKWLRRLQVHLQPLIRGGLIELWDDTRLKAGAHWREELRQALDQATVAVLLVSADFMASDFIAKDELPPILRSAAERGLRVLPINVSASIYAHVPELEQFQSVNPPDRPLNKVTRAEQERVLVELARTIMDAAGSGSTQQHTMVRESESKVQGGLSSVSSVDAVDIQDLKSCLALVEDLLRRLHNLKKAVLALSSGNISSDEFHRLQELDENRVSDAEVRELDLLCLSVLNRVLPAEDRNIQNWLVHENRGYAVEFDVSDFSRKRIVLQVVLNRVNS